MVEECEQSLPHHAREPVHRLAGGGETLEEHGALLHTPLEIAMEHNSSWGNLEQLRDHTAALSEAEPTNCLP
eukprot:7342606-Alexandrium_andersonii.AAC.1